MPSSPQNKQIAIETDTALHLLELVEARAQKAQAYLARLGARDNVDARVEATLLILEVLIAQMELERKLESAGVSRGAITEAKSRKWVASEEAAYDRRLRAWLGR